MREEFVWAWIRNLRSVHHRWMAAWLRRKGWVAFYLDEEARDCDGGIAGPDFCWLHLYRSEQERTRTGRASMKKRFTVAVVAALLLSVTAAAAQQPARRGKAVVKGMFGGFGDPEGIVTFPAVPWDGGTKWEGGSRLVIISVASRDPLEPSSYVQFQAGAATAPCTTGSHIRLVGRPQMIVEPTANGQVFIWRVDGNQFKCKQLQGPRKGTGISAFGAQYGVDISGYTLSLDGLSDEGNEGHGPFFNHRPDLWAVWKGHVRLNFEATFPGELEETASLKEQRGHLLEQTESLLGTIQRNDTLAILAERRIRELLQVSLGRGRTPTHHDEIDRLAKEAIEILAGREGEDR